MSFLTTKLLQPKHIGAYKQSLDAFQYIYHHLLLFPIIKLVLGILYKPVQNPVLFAPIFDTHVRQLDFPLPDF